ncbi:cytochrome P450 82A4 [Arachis duranensis]|uniref:Cytochrome P450 82A4 n=1 Tax=Arachis duranensis TaxID=130453 RepID=A0A6P4B9J9_ARADU|nr:cytochrome P450 82A4 [Arachis duranensis]
MSFCLSATYYQVIGLVSLILLPFLFLFRRSKLSGGRREPPLAAGAWPIIGHLPLFAASGPPHKTLGAMADKYGTLFTIKIGSQRAVVINNWKTAKECFTTNDVTLSSRPSNLIAVERLAYKGAMFPFAPNHLYWREMRRIANQELLSNKRVELLGPVRVSEVESSIKALFKKWEDEKNESGYVAVEMKKWFGELIINTILRVFSGKRYLGGDSGSSEEGRRCLKALREFVQQLGMILVGDAVPWLRWVDLGGHEKAMKETAKELDAICGKWLEEHRMKRVLEEDGRSQDFIDVMLSVLDGTDELAGYDVDTIIKATVLILTAGAVDTSTVSLTWIITCLLNNIVSLEEAQKELDIQVGKERFVNESDMSNLVYIQAIVKETLRLHPPSTLSGLRVFTEDCTIGGYYIPKGTPLMTNLWKIHRDPSVWLHPFDFKPERFLSGNHKNVDVRGNHFELIPFGSGRRMCPGISFAMPMIHLTLATFLQSFEISKPSHEPIDMTEIFGLTSTKATPLDVLIKPRLFSKLYEDLH